MIPVVFIHRGGLPFVGDRFLRIALRQAKLASPLNPIFLLTDYVRPRLSGINQVRLRDLGDPAASLNGSYQHASSNHVGYERFCFSRWFYLRSFMTLRRIERACVLDSDIMLFSPIDNFVAEFAGYEAGNWSWANVVTTNGIELICDHLMRSCRDGELRALILAATTGSFWNSSCPADSRRYSCSASSISSGFRLSQRSADRPNPLATRRARFPAAPPRLPTPRWPAPAAASGHGQPGGTFHSAGASGR